MYYELALISTVVACGYWGWVFARGRLRGYGLLLLAAAALAGLGMLGRGHDVPMLGVAGAVGLGAGVCLFVLGPLALQLAVRATRTERFGLAERLLEIADVLAPGRGARDHKALLAVLRETHRGNIEPTLEALRAAKTRAPFEARSQIDERIAMLYLAVHRWDDAIAHAEANLFLGAATMPPPSGTDLRSVLGVGPPLFVELLGAYGYTGNLGRAATMLTQLEDACVGRGDAAEWLHRGRLVFCAFAGRVDAVRSLVAPAHSRHMTRAARLYWVAVAHERHGDREQARAAYTSARSRSRGRPRALVDEALARVETIGEQSLSPEAQAVAARVEAAPVPAFAGERRRGPIASRVLAAVLVLVAIAIAALVGDATDVGVLVRAGAMVRGMVTDGEWWRLVSGIFVHVGGAHLLVNLIGLLVIGRLAEAFFGAWRTAAIFALAALAGAVASYLASPAGISAGASGGIFGVLGAVFVEVTLRRRTYPGPWLRAVWGALAVVTVAQLAVDFLYPVIDQTAHAVGLAIGALSGLLWSPRVRRARLATAAARAVVAAFAVVAIASAVLIARTPLAASLARAPLIDHQVGGIGVTAPASWRVTKDQLADADQLIVMSFAREGGAESEIAAWIDKQTAREHGDGGELVASADRVLVLPAAWQSGELQIALADASGEKQLMRGVYAGRALGDSVVLVEVLLPDSVARAAGGFVAQVLGSVTAAR
jgi:rhomboid protease GluP